MSWFKTPTLAHKPDFVGLQLQTAASALPIPIIYGQTKLAANIIWYANFQVHGPNKTGKGGLFSTPTAQTTTYKADVIMALCEGPIKGINVVWRDQSFYTIDKLALTLFTGTTPQAVWGYLATAYPAQALAYQGTAYLAAGSYALGAAASIGNHNFEVQGILWGTGVNGIDADPTQVIYDFLTNTQYGIGFNPASIDTTTLFGVNGDGSLQTYCRALGIAFSPALVSAEQGSAILARWLKLVNCAAVWSGGKLKFIPYGDVTVPGGAILSTTAPLTIPSPPAGFPTIIVSGASQFVSDGGVIMPFSKTVFTHTGTAPTGPGTYGISPPGTYLFNVADATRPVEISFAYSTPGSYVPYLTPLYNLQDTDFVDDSAGSDPLQISRIDPFTIANITRLSCLSRSNGYAQVPVEARDQSQIEIYGQNIDSTIQGNEITDDVNIGRIVAQTVHQRELYIRATYKFKLSWEYALLEPMDIVTLTDIGLGLNGLAVRVISVEEDEQGMLAVEAEDLDVLVSTPVLYPTDFVIGGALDRGAQAQPVNTPLIFEPPPQLTNGVAQLWFGASGGLAGVPDPNWGGCFVWISLDNATYSQVGTISQPMRQGFVSAALATAAVPWNPAQSFGVDLSESGGVLSGTTTVSAQAGVTLALVGGELLAYVSATLTGVSAYTLAGLQRGLYQTTIGAHAISVPFARLDGAIFSYTLPASYIGASLFLKFQSFNVFGGGVQPLSDCVAYTHNVLGSGVAMPSNIVNFGGALTLDGTAYTLAGQWTADPNATGYTVQWSLDGATNWKTVYSGPNAAFSARGFGYIATLYLRVEGVNGPYVSPTWTQITLVQGAQTTQPVENVGLYVQYQSLSPTFQAQIDALTVAANSVVTSARADIVNYLELAQADAAEATAFLVSTHASSQTAAVAKTAALGVANAAAGLTLSLNTTSSVLNAAIASNYALIVSDEVAQATVNSALAGSITTLTTNVNTSVADLQGQVTSLAATSGTSNSVVSTKSDTIAAAVSAGQDTQDATDFLAAVAAHKDLGTALAASNVVGAAVTNSNIAIATLNFALATTSQTLGAGVAGSKALIAAESLTRATADTALSASITSLTATVSGNLSTATGLVTTETTARATADTALSTSITNLTATVSGNLGTVNASITAEAGTRATADTSLTTLITNLTSTVTGNLGTVNASITSEAATRTTADLALGVRVDTVSATAAQGTAAGKIQFAAIAGGGLVSAAYTLQVDVTGGGVFNYAGFKVEALNSGLSQIVMDANKFIVQNNLTKTVVFATNSDGTLQLQGVTKVASIIKSLGSGSNGQPFMSIDFTSAPSIIIDDGV